MVPCPPVLYHTRRAKSSGAGGGFVSPGFVLRASGQQSRREQSGQQSGEGASEIVFHGNLLYCRRFGKLINAIIYENADYILSSSQKLLEMVDNFIDVSEMQANTLVLDQEVYNFNDAIMSIVKEDGQKIGDKEIDFLFNLSSNVPNQLIGDRRRVMAIIHNLLSNSIKYTNKGKIELTIRSSIHDDICTLVVTISDTGKGISERQQESIFSLFERSTSDKNSSISGAGVGLAITKYLVELMGGKISVQSEVDNGSIFIVQIPQRIPNIEKT